jgi:hypothetical protein
VTRIPRIALAFAIAATISATRPASAAGCPLVTDAATDDAVAGSSWSRSGTDADLDIRSADIGSDGHGVTVVVRLSGLHQLDPGSPLGRIFLVKFVARDFTIPAGQTPSFRQYYVAIIIDPRGGVTAEWGQYVSTATERLDTAAVTVDLPRAQVRATFSYRADRAYRALGTKQARLGSLGVTSYRLVAQLPDDPTAQVARLLLGTTSHLVVSSDEADTTRVYVGGTKGCIPRP